MIDEIVNCVIDRCVVYIATGDVCRAEVTCSLESLRKVMPEIEVTIFSDKDEFVTREQYDFKLIQTPKYSTFDKVENLSHAPYLKTLYLDSDTYVTQSLNIVFELLEKFDFCAAHETARGLWYEDIDCEFRPVFPPGSFPDVNGGVIGFRADSAGSEVIRKWPLKYADTCDFKKRIAQGKKWIENSDQLSLRLLLWEQNNLRLAILPTEFNAMRYWGTYLWGKAYIVHGRGDIRRIAKQMNAAAGVQRVHLQGLGTVAPFRQSSFRDLAVIFLRFHAELGLSIVHKIRHALFG